jgi:hypothetical protein
MIEFPGIIKKNKHANHATFALHQPVTSIHPT